MGERMGDMEGDISHVVEDMDDMTAVMSGMNIRYDGFYDEFRQMQLEQQRYYSLSADCTSQMLAHMHLDHPHFNGPPYV